MARPNAEGDHGTFSPVVAARPSNKALRIAATGAAVILACAAVVALVGVSTQSPQKSELVIVQPKSSIDELADFFLANGANMSPKEALSKIQAWNSGTAPVALAAVKAGAKTQMLNYKGEMEQQQLAGSSLLCEKRAKIIQLFDQLLAKLGGEELSANITMGKVSKEWHDALSTWLDAESKYRLTVEKTKEAKQGSAFAQDEYEKWKTAYKRAKEDLDATLARHAEERQNLLDERELIKEIMRMIGVLHDVKATEKSIAAGGRDSVKDEETGVSDPYNIKTANTKAVLQAKVNKLKQLVLKTKLPGATQKLAQIEQLPVYSETEEVAKILKEMLSDLSTRLSVINEVDAQAKKLVDDAYAKMVEWEKKLVKLADGLTPLILPLCSNPCLLVVDVAGTTVGKGEVRCSQVLSRSTDGAPMRNNCSIVSMIWGAGWCSRFGGGGFVCGGGVARARECSRG
jgi:hypothetical protein